MKGKQKTMLRIAMSVSNHVNDEVTALNLGADDYMTKPFSSEQLLARVRVALRHARQGTTDSFTSALRYRKILFCLEL